MGLDLAVYKQGQLIANFNTLRNPFGLIEWIQTNLGVEAANALHEVLNSWAYYKSAKVDRARFYTVIARYKEAVDGLTAGFFRFNVQQYMNCVEHRHIELNRVKYEDNGDSLLLPMELFTDITLKDLNGYKAWYGKLMQVAEALLDPTTTFFCEN